MDELRPSVRLPAGRAVRSAGVGVAIALIGAIAAFSSIASARFGPAPMAGGAASPEALALMVADAMRAGDVGRLRGLAMTEEEFRTHVWPSLPAARPERNVPFDFVWDRLAQNSEAQLAGTIAAIDAGDVGALPLRAVRFARETSYYGDVAVHRRTELLFQDGDGRERLVRLFGSTVEQNGRFKVFSYVVSD